MRKLLLAGAAIIAGAMFGSTDVYAAAITIDDTTDNIVVSWADFDIGGFSVNGSASTQNGSVTVAEGTPLTFSGSWLFNPPITTGTFNYVLLEPPTNSISDVLSYTISASGSVATIAGSFCSDSDTGPACAAPTTGTTTTAVETGAPVLFSATNLTGSFRSDPPEAVSEPASLALFGMGLLGMYGLTRRRVGRGGHVRMA